MATAAIRTDAWALGATAWRLPAWVWAATLLMVPILMGASGYKGGGSDDWYYLEAARCAAAHGICLPETHWAARFPLILPMGAATALFGDARWPMELVPLCYAVAAVVLFVLNVERRFGAAPAALAGAALALTPEFALDASQPGVDLAEFAWAMAALLAIQISFKRRSNGIAALAGAFLAVAVMTRASALVLLPVLGTGWLLLDARRKWLALPFGFAFAAVLGAEAMAYFWVGGDPLHGWKLSLNHTRIPSTELPPGVDLSRGALLNLEFIRNWRRSMGIEIHWTIDPLLNLLAHPACGLTLAGAVALGVLRRAQWRRDSLLPWLTAAAVIHFLLLTYVLAIDPKPRMFFLGFAVAATIIGVLGTSVWSAGSRAILIVLLALLPAGLLLMSYDTVRFAAPISAAAQWIEEAPPGTLAIDETTRRVLALVPAARGLPSAAAAPLRPRLVLGLGRCKATGGIVRAARFVESEPAPLAWARSHSVLLRPRPPVMLCIVRPASPA